MMLTTLPKAHVADRARLGVAVRSISGRPGCRASGLASFATDGYAANATMPLTVPTTVWTTKRPARHLATRTT